MINECQCESPTGSGGGTSGRAMAFCLDSLGLNPGSDFNFLQFIIAVNLFSLGVRLFLITCNRMVHTLSSSFLFPIIIYQCENYQFKVNMKKERIIQREAGKGPNLKNAKLQCLSAFELTC